VNIRLAAAGAVCAVAAAATGNALACGDGGSMNEVASPAVKAALNQAFVAAHPQLRASDVSRVVGRTYYGTMGGGSEYAVATFVTPQGVWHPTILSRAAGRPWHVIRQTHGGICTRWVPESLIALWYFERWHGTDCFVEPA
jgi:hypothetical protein